MKPTAVRRLATERTLAELEAAIEVVSEEGVPPFELEADEAAEGLTHLLLAARVRRRVDGGEELKEAFRAEMSAVRDVLTNG